MKRVISLLLILSLMILVGCEGKHGSGNSNISGTYIEEGGSGRTLVFSGKDNVELNGNWGTYAISGNTITVIFSGNAQTYAFSQVSDSLVIDGVVYTKGGKDVAPDVAQTAPSFDGIQSETSGSSDIVIEDSAGDSVKVVERIYNATDFSNGIAFIQIESPDIGNRQWYAINNSGEIVFELNGRPFQWQYKYSNDYFMSSYIEKDGNLRMFYINSDEVLQSIDDKGNIVYTFDSDEYDTIASFNDQVFEDLVIVSKKINTFEKTETQYGVIDINGKWVMELQPVLGFDFNRMLLAYLGNGWFYSASEKSKGQMFPEEWIFLNVYSKKEFVLPYGRSITLPSNFKGEKSVFSQNILHREKDSDWSFVPLEEDLYALNSNGDYYRIVENLRADIITTSNESFACRLDGHISGPVYIYDYNGNLKIDLSKYDVEYISSFSDGFCSVELSNEQGSTFYTIIDEQGNMMFEPKPKSERSRNMDIGPISCGVLPVRTEDDGFDILDMNGNIIGHIEKHSAITTKFFDNLIRIVSPSGETEYFDIYGKKLEISF